LPQVKVSLFRYNSNMKKLTLLIWPIGLLAVLLVSACRPATPDPILQIRLAVDSTLAAIPTSTPYKLPTPYPTPTSFSLIGLFCEYQFCIGHPPEIAFFDLNDRTSPSTYSEGSLSAVNANLFVLLLWQFAPGTKDPQFLLDLIIKADNRSGNLDTKLIRNMNVLYTPITTTATPLLPFGAAAAWTCGDRVFAWKVYTPQAETTQALFDSTIARFTCGQ
jgi:hypothetical protein